MYAIIVELGMDVGYFMDRAQPYEIEPLIEGLAKRREYELSQTRLICYYAARPHLTDLDIKSIISLSGDKETESITDSDRSFLEAAKKFFA